MNKRIRELAEQAEDWADNQNLYESDHRDYLMEKFAQLIVRECLSIADRRGAYEVMDDIIEHFGVEQ